MSSDAAQNGTDHRSAQELAEDRTALATSRTLMAADRSLMAWVRTSLSMLSFGFTIYKMLQGFQEAGAILQEHATPRRVGLFLTALGTVAMLMGTFEYRHRIAELRKFGHVSLKRPAFFMAIFMSIFGVFLFVSIITRLF